MILNFFNDVQFIATEYHFQIDFLLDFCVFSENFVEFTVRSYLNLDIAEQLIRFVYIYLC